MEEVSVIHIIVPIFHISYNTCLVFMVLPLQYPYLGKFDHDLTEFSRALESCLGFGESSPNDPTIQLSEIWWPLPRYIYIYIYILYIIHIHTISRVKFQPLPSLCFTGKTGVLRRSHRSFYSFGRSRMGISNWAKFRRTLLKPNGRVYVGEPYIYIDR